MKKTIPSGPRSLMLLFLLLLAQASAFSQNKGKREFYQLVVYHYNTPDQETALDQYLEKAYLPALHRLQFPKIGVFKPIQNDTASDKRIYVLVPFRSLDELIKIPAALG